MTHNSQGTTARPKLDDEAFEAFMKTRRPVSPIWTMSGLDGYLTALIIGPKFIDPREWIPELTGPEALNMPMETTAHQAVQTIVADYNRISASLAETPALHRPRFSRIDDRTFDSMDWHVSFLMGTGFSQKQWRLVIRGHAVTGGIIAPIRKLSEATGPATQSDAAAVAEALVKIRSYFMPKRAKQKF
ncbi:MAG: YecA family protein [Rhizobium leguminosarum]